MILLIYKPELGAKTIRAQIELINATIPDVITVDLEDDFDFTGHTVINVGSHQYAGSEILNKARERLAKCEKLVVLMDDYTAPPASQIFNAVRGKENIMVTTVPEILEVKSHLRKYNWATKAIYANLNALSWDPRPLIRNPPVEGLVYYGMFRDGRAEAFETYLGTESSNWYETAVSASRRAMSKFWDINPMIDDFPKSKDLVGFLQDFEFTIYLEDKFSSENYTSPANRFYECASAGVPLFFDECCLATFEKVGIKISDYLVTGPEDIFNHVCDARDEIAEEQRLLWGGRDYKQEATEAFRAVLNQIQ